MASDVYHVIIPVKDAKNALFSNTCKPLINILSTLHTQQLKDSVFSIHSCIQIFVSVYKYYMASVCF